MIMPIIWLCAYSWLGDQYKASVEDGRLVCAPKDSKVDAYNNNYLVWVLLYQFVPAGVIIVLNIAIVVSLRKFKQLDKALAPSQPLGMHRSGNQHEAESNFTLVSEDGPSCITEEQLNDESDEETVGSDHEDKNSTASQKCKIKYRIFIKFKMCLCKSCHL